jgi:CO dehydrogenase maturation factor
VKKVRVIANKVRNEEDEQFVRARIPEEALLGIVHYTGDVQEADRAGKSPYDYSKQTVEEIRAIKARIDGE